MQTNLHRTPDRARHLRQSIELTGLNTPIFQTCITNIQQIHTIFAQHMAEGTLEDFQLSMFQDSTCITAGTHYITSRHEDWHSPAILIPRSLDPKGILASHCIGEQFYGPENEVLYYGVVSTEGKPTRCVSQSVPSNITLIPHHVRFAGIGPMIFKVGDIVEVQMTAAVIPLKNARFKMILNLHSLALLDGSYSRVRTNCLNAP